MSTNKKTKKEKEKKPVIVPRGNYMLVRPDDPAARENKYGLVVPSTEEQERKAQGVVFAVSEEIKGVKKGDKVIYGVYAGENIKLRESDKEIDYKLLHNDDVIAFLR